ncbi:hypothetical protein H9639_04815 [Arthrobacter sp. Sa2CUA1]|uniref:DsrE family protein n=1 Tax=Arthrobacter gallicola TaxID=2762225 RepID=A0ABR8UPW8_9MICC|nr:hypothetical protein [Arthrobacter gallicola]MBD7994613.1 hypothetical protein [Arthrobacter gallicola]
MVQDHRVVVLHASNEPADVERALAAAETLRTKGLPAHVRIIVNGAALDGLTGTEPVSLPPDTEVEACLVGMGKRGITTNQLRPAVRTVPAAVAALAQAQFDGAAYIRL